jgi:ABC-2 type transport system permease protein
VVLSFLVASLAAGAGVLISLRAATVRQAQQTFSILNLILFIPLFLLPVLPEAWQNRIAGAAMQADVKQIVLAVAAVLLLIDLALLGAVLARFQRSRLILD